MSTLEVNAIFSSLPLNYYAAEGHSIATAIALHMQPNNDLPLGSFQAKSSWWDLSFIRQKFSVAGSPPPCSPSRLYHQYALHLG